MNSRPLRCSCCLVVQLSNEPSTCTCSPPWLPTRIPLTRTTCQLPIETWLCCADWHWTEQTLLGGQVVPPARQRTRKEPETVWLLPSSNTAAILGTTVQDEQNMTAPNPEALVRGWLHALPSSTAKQTLTWPGTAAGRHSLSYLHVISTGTSFGCAGQPAAPTNSVPRRCAELSWSWRTCACAMGSIATCGVYVRGEPGLTGGEPTRKLSAPSAGSSPCMLRLAWVFPCSCEHRYRAVGYGLN